ncbi:MAG: hypothetical protein AAF658_01745 [Myxococcota bacterium]
MIPTFLSILLVSPQPAFFDENAYLVNVTYSDASGLVSINDIPAQRLQPGTSSSFQFQPHTLLRPGKNTIRFDGVAKEIAVSVSLVRVGSLPAEGKPVATLERRGSASFRVPEAHLPDYPWHQGDTVQPNDCALAKEQAEEMLKARTSHNADAYLAASEVALTTRALAFPRAPLDRLKQMTRKKIERRFEDTYVVETVGATACAIGASKKLLTVTKQGWHGYFVARDQEFGTSWVESYIFMKRDGKLLLTIIR